VLAELVREARAAGAHWLIGRYIPSEKNMMVARHYEKLGFEQIETLESGESVWRLAVADAPEPELPMQIIRPAGASGR